ncbi:glycosyl hydrolase family 5 protein/cellulase [Coprinopsis marcescibilis]|uniref:Glycosyl hydrolase family 5 protein/cellulase n=1 Tax=Coprinopsis marcescibilis TaxID=230819 RepID=A0A5C3KWW4_COPMA|nr:glycosyl hydrolase family 5 protein/cellulase [Coprinopsis marcescibilis]
MKPFQLLGGSVARFFLLSISFLLYLINPISAVVLRTNSRWIVDASTNQRVKLRCVNWAGHMETNIPEGLQAQPVANIAAWIANNRFNCVRLTFSIDLALNPNFAVSTSFNNAAGSAGVPLASMQGLYNRALEKNPWLGNSTTRGAFARVIQELASRNVLVILDNHVSRASWCCGTSDGNGWWASASGYNANNSRFFDTNNWLNGLRAMASFSAAHPNVVGIGLRNEVRAVGSQDGNNHADWYNLMGRGGEAVRQGNSNLLIIVGGVGYATDLSYLGNRPLDRAIFGQDKLVYEYHNYQWSNGNISCDEHRRRMGNGAGYLLTQNQPYTGPLWVSEFGWAQSNPSAQETAYIRCLVSYLESNDADWAYWALQGSYYVREARVDFDESFGVLNKDWSGWRNGSFTSTLGRLFDVTQGP